MQAFYLKLGDSTWLFSADASGWCSIALASNGSETILGSDSIEIIKGKLKAAFSTPIDSNEPEWVLTLSEQHHSLYRQKTCSGVRYFWQNGNGQTIWQSVNTMPLSHDQLQVLS